MTRDASPDFVLAASAGGAATSSGAGMVFIVVCAVAVSANVSKASSSIKCIGNPLRGILARLSLKPIELLLQRFQPLPRLAELAFGGQPLILREIARGSR